MGDQQLPVLLDDVEAMRRLHDDFRCAGAAQQLDVGRDITYLDHAGASLASRQQLDDVFRALTAAPLTNPHSVSPVDLVFLLHTSSHQHSLFFS